MMKKQFTTKMKVLTAIGVLSTMSLTAIAAPILQEVSATLRKDITFTLNGEKTLEGTNVLMYENSAYLPLRALGDELGMKIDYVDGEIKITNEANGMSKTISADAIPATELTPALEGVYIPSATIKSIEKESNQITILPTDKEDAPYNYIVLNLSKDMKTEDFKVDMTVSVTHSPAMTRSMPPQTAAFEIKEVEAIAPLENVTLKDVVITEISDDKISITVGPVANPEDRNAQTVIHISNDAGTKTNIRHHMDKKLYTAADLKVGQNLTVIHQPMMTLSLPPQTTAIEIILMD